MDNEKIIALPKETVNRFLSAEHEWSAMRSFIRENLKDCNDLSREVPKYLRKRYGLSFEWLPIGLAWYLLDEYFKGNIIIKKDAQPE